MGLVVIPRGMVNQFEPLNVLANELLVLKDHIYDKTIFMTRIINTYLNSCTNLTSEAAITCETIVREIKNICRNKVLIY